MRVWDVETGECLKVMEGHTVGEVGGGEQGREEGGERERWTRRCACGTWRRGSV